MPRHIGIVACSAEGAALCYRTICAEGARFLGPHGHPEISMHTHPLAAYMRYIERDDWDGVGALMLSSAEKLARVGADFLICPDNTIHRALPGILGRSPLPWLHIADIVMAHAAERGFRRVGLTGTRYLVESDVYPEQCLRPDADERAEINRIIFDELVYGDFRPEAVRTFQRVIGRMKEAGCDAVILGCTEVPLIMNDDNSPLPTLDSTRLLARAALRRAIEESMTHDLNDTIALLTRTPAALDALLRGLPALWISRNEGEGTWTVTEVIGHLIHGERTDWIPRATRILTDGDSRPFDSFDRLGHMEAIRGKSLEQLLDEFAALRAEGLRALDAIRTEDLDRRGQHPALGSVTLSQLLATWAAHDLSHLHQISRIMAAQYRQHVGPWSAYLGVMQCDGHSG